MPDTAVGTGWEDDDDRLNRRMPIEELNLSMRAYNCLRRSGIQTVGDIMTCSPDDLLALRNFGVKSLAEVLGRLSELLSEEA